MIVYTKHLQRGLTLWPFIFIPEKMKGNKPYLSHEQCHYRQQGVLMPVFVVLYILSKKFRFTAEVEAFMAQIDAELVEWRELGIDKDRHEYATFLAKQLSEQYWGCCTYDEAAAALK